jgi:outer membrane lipoprotein-sorting protein
MKMKKIVLAMTLLLLAGATAFAQTASAVLDKCAATVTSSEGVSASFTMTSAQYGDASGTISLKGKKFCMRTDATSMWFDGTTLWTYVASNEEVNISTPTAQQLQTLNPYNFINLYKSGYKTTMTSSPSTFDIHLTASSDQYRIREAFLTVDKTSYAPKVIKMLTGTKWSTFTISGLKKEPMSDSQFRFDANAYPDAEIIDLR